MQRSDRNDPMVENGSLVERDTDSTDSEYGGSSTMVAYTEPSTISEFQITHQDLLEEFILGTWESVLDSDETIEIADGSFIRRIDGEVIEEGYLYPYIVLGRDELRQAIEAEQELLLTQLLEIAKEGTLENIRVTGYVGFIMMDDEDQIFDSTIHTRLLGIRIAWSPEGIELQGISVDLRAFRRPK